MIVIDTSVAINFLRGEKRTVSTLDSIISSGDMISVSTVSFFELLHPLRHRKLREQEKAVRSFFRQLNVLPLDSDSADHATEIMGSLLRIGQPVNALDVLIAGTALANNAELIISGNADFRKIGKVSDLKVQVIENSTFAGDK